MLQLTHKVVLMTKVQQKKLNRRGLTPSSALSVPTVCYFSVVSWGPLDVNGLLETQNILSPPPHHPHTTTPIQQLAQTLSSRNEPENNKKSPCLYHKLFIKSKENSIYQGDGEKSKPYYMGSHLSNSQHIRGSHDISSAHHRYVAST